ncbi:hypothetical protein Taro_049806 [Colocasia esculenta]|uniref:Uncharacterized protein n=1 Tax=Colocasia esculenta TaxID=4460 RepID=A0A843XC15_COLES|nr:hypothetical protein [Colocasia esculenta]
MRRYKTPTSYLRPSDPTTTTACPALTCRADPATPPRALEVSIGRRRWDMNAPVVLSPFVWRSPTRKSAQILSGLLPSIALRLPRWERKLRTFRTHPPIKAKVFPFPSSQAHIPHHHQLRTPPIPAHPSLVIVRFFLKAPPTTMDFLFAMSVFSSAADISREQGKAKEWLRAWVARDGTNKGAAAAEQGKLPQQRQGGPEAQEKKQPQGGRPWLAPEFDGLNCFETIVSH